MNSVFGNGEKFWEIIPVELRFRDTLCGTKPMSSTIYLDHLRRKTGITDERELRRLFLIDLQQAGAFDENLDVDEVIENMSEVEMYEYVQKAAEKYQDKALTGFWSDEDGLYIENYQVKGMLKEAVSIVYPWNPAKGAKKGKWGPTKKSPKDYAAERLNIRPRKISLGRKQADGIREITGKVSGPTGKRQIVSRYEYVEKTKIAFEIMVPKDPMIGGEFDAETWEKLFDYAQQNGLGGARSTGNGTFNVVRFGDMVLDEGGEAAA